MKVLGISVKQVVVGIEFTPQELTHLKWFLDRSTVEYDGENEIEAVARDYVVETLCPVLSDLLEELNRGPR